MIRYLFFSSDGKKLFHAQGDNISVWDTRTCTPIFRYSGFLIGISHNNQNCITYSKNSSVVAWDLNTGNKLDFQQLDSHDFPFHQRVMLSHNNKDSLFVHDVFFPQQPAKRIFIHEHIHYRSPILKAPQSSFVLLDSDWSAGHFEGSSLLCYDIDSGTIVFSENYNYSNVPIFSPEHDLLIVGHLIFDTFSGEKIKKMDRPSLFRSASIDPKNLSRIVIAVRRKLEFVDLSIQPDKTVQLIEKKSMKTEKAINESDIITDIAFHPDGNRIACVLRNGSIHIWNITTNQIISENQV